MPGNPMPGICAMGAPGGPCCTRPGIPGTSPGRGIPIIGWPSIGPALTIMGPEWAGVVAGADCITIGPAADMTTICDGGSGPAIMGAPPPINCPPAVNICPPGIMCPPITIGPAMRGGPGWGTGEEAATITPGPGMAWPGMGMEEVGNCAWSATLAELYFGMAALLSS